MLSKKMKQFTIVDIIERQMQFIESNTVFDKIEFKYDYEGKLLAYNEMLKDIKIMNENDFANKYFNIVKNLRTKLNNEESLNPEYVEKMSGYDGSIELILTYIDPMYEHDLPEGLYDLTPQDN